MDPVPSHFKDLNELKNFFLTKGKGSLTVYRENMPDYPGMVFELGIIFDGGKVNNEGKENDEGKEKYELDLQWIAYGLDLFGEKADLLRQTAVFVLNRRH